MRWPALCAILVGCGSHPPAAPPSNVAAASAPVSCPASFAAAPGACTAEGATCTWPEGDCACAKNYPCSGGNPASHEAALAAMTLEWRCTPATRPDGCPGHIVDGAPCTLKHGCYVAGCAPAQYHCTSGAWKLLWQARDNRP